VSCFEDFEVRFYQLVDFQKISSDTKIWRSRSSIDIVMLKGLQSLHSSSACGDARGRSSGDSLTQASRNMTHDSEDAVCDTVEHGKEKTLSIGSRCPFQYQSTGIGLRQTRHVKQTTNSWLKLGRVPCFDIAIACLPQSDEIAVTPQPQHSDPSHRLMDGHSQRPIFNYKDNSGRHTRTRQGCFQAYSGTK
jgi:hypothetical protein